MKYSRSTKFLADVREQLCSCREALKSRVLQVNYNLHYWNIAICIPRCKYNITWRNSELYKTRSKLIKHKNFKEARTLPLNSQRALLFNLRKVESKKRSESFFFFFRFIPQAIVYNSSKTRVSSAVRTDRRTAEICNTLPRYLSGVWSIHVRSFVRMAFLSIPSGESRGEERKKERE